MEIDTARPDVRAEADELTSLMLAGRFEPAAYANLKQFAVATTIDKSVGPVAEGAWAVLHLCWFAAAVIGSFLTLYWKRRRRAVAADE
jgi:hypothetical protein